MDIPALEEIITFIPPKIRPDINDDIKENLSHFSNPRITKWKEHCVASPLNASVLEWQYNNWYPTEDDVLIASFPRTGTTWMTKIAKTIIYWKDVEMMKLANAVTPVHCYLEVGTPTTYEIMEKLPWKRRVYATHAPSTLINMRRLKKRGCKIKPVGINDGSQTKIICTIRNPKDQLVSWYNITKGLPFYKGESLAEYFPTDWNDFVQTVVSGKQPLCDKEGEWYPDYLLSWLSYYDDENVLCIMYEDLKKDLCKELRKIAKFLGVNRTGEELMQIADEVSFANMKQKPTIFQEWAKVIRKGQVGDWKNYFTVSQSEVMDKKIAEKLSHTRIKFVYEM